MTNKPEDRMDDRSRTDQGNINQQGSKPGQAGQQQQSNTGKGQQGDSAQNAQTGKSQTGQHSAQQSGQQPGKD